jgi:hypothetical protein
MATLEHQQWLLDVPPPLPIKRPGGLPILQHEDLRRIPRGPWRPPVFRKELHKKERKKYILKVSKYRNPSN